MLKIIRQKKLQEEAKRLREQGSNQVSKPTNNNLTTNSSSSSLKKSSVAEVRVQKDLSELSLGSNMKMTFPDASNILNFNLSIKPDEGIYKDGNFKFKIIINESYPHEPPKIHCISKIYHPNIDLEGNICLNILREDWTPVLDINAVLIGLQSLLLEPNGTDPLNKEAANDLLKNEQLFARHVSTAMRGGYVGDEKFDNVLY